MAVNFSKQSDPLGSASEWTKQEKASLKASPQGPWAIPPRQGQSQLISPVSGSYAADWFDLVEEMDGEGSRKWRVSFPSSSCLEYDIVGKFCVYRNGEGTGAGAVVRQWQLERDGGSTEKKEGDI